MNYKYDIDELEAQIAKAEARIKELEAEAEADQEAPPVWVPDDGEMFYFPDVNAVSTYWWYYTEADKNSLNAGYVFKTKQEAEDYYRARRLIETMRRERHKAQGDWWLSGDDASWSICWDHPRDHLDMYHTGWALSSDVFGRWQDADALQDVIKKYESELEWYFTEYLPSVN